MRCAFGKTLVPIAGRGKLVHIDLFIYFHLHDFRREKNGNEWQYTSGGFIQRMLTSEQEQMLSKIFHHLLAAHEIEIELVSHGKMPMSSSLDSARLGLSAAIGGLKAALNK